MSAVSEVDGHDRIGCDVPAKAHLEVGRRVNGGFRVEDELDALVLAVVVDLVEVEEDGDSSVRRQAGEGPLHAEELELDLAAAHHRRPVARINAVVLQARVDPPTRLPAEVSDVLDDICDVQRVGGVHAVDAVEGQRRLAGEALHHSIGGVAGLAGDRTDLAKLGLFVVPCAAGAAGVVGELVAVSAGCTGSVAL